MTWSRSADPAAEEAAVVLGEYLGKNSQNKSVSLVVLVVVLTRNRNRAAGAYA